MAQKVSLGFAMLSDAELDNFTQTVINEMTGNATFPPPPVTLANLQTARDGFTAKIAAAQVGGRRTRQSRIMHVRHCSA